MRFLTNVLAAVLVVGVAAGVAGYKFWQNDQVTATEVIQRTFDVGPEPRVIVETFNGAVEVSTILENHIEARVTKRASGSDETAAEEALDQINVTITQEGDTVRVVATKTDGLLHFGTRSAPVQIQAPAGTRVVLRSPNGKIEIAGPVGDVLANTSNGAISVKGSRGELKLTTSNGPIQVEGGRGKIEARTSNGSVDIQTKNAVVTARTSNGRIRCAGALGEGDHHLASSNGAITLTLPADSQFRLDARTSNGKISSEFTVKAEGKPVRRRLTGSVGDDPKRKIKLETSNGSIEVRRE